ncbi:MAG: hypothetical protein ACTSYS_07020 [Promethearchaeota archaeon]
MEVKTFQEHLEDTAILTLSTQRDITVMFQVVHELVKSNNLFPDLFSVPAIQSSESVKSMINVAPRVINYHLYGLPAISTIVNKINNVMDWAIYYYANVMLSLYRGFFPKLYAPNVFYNWFMTETESSLLKCSEDKMLDESTFFKKLDIMEDLKESIESIWNLKFKKLSFRVGPVAPQDLLITNSNNDNMVIIHPTAPFSHYWPGILVYKLTRLLLDKSFPKINDRFRDFLSILTVRALIGDALKIPGTFFEILDKHPVDHAQYQISLISRDLNLYGGFNQKLIHFFPRMNTNDAYNLDMIKSIIPFVIDDDVLDKRELFARITASNAGYKNFQDKFLLFEKALEHHEKIGIFKLNEDSYLINLLEWKPTK